MVTIRIKKVSKINIVLGAMIAAASGASRFNQQLKKKGLQAFLGTKIFLETYTLC